MAFPTPTSLASFTGQSRLWRGGRAEFPIGDAVMWWLAGPARATISRRRAREFPKRKATTHRNSSSTSLGCWRVLQDYARCLGRGHFHGLNTPCESCSRFIALISETGTDGAAEIVAFFARLEFEFTLPCSWPASKDSDRKLDDQGTQSCGCGRHASMEVESSPLVPTVPTRFRSIVEHDKGGVFYRSLALVWFFRLESTV